jgi:hypothetical protein
MKTDYENITPFTRWITDVDDYDEEISRFEEKAAKIVNKYYEKMRSEILKEIEVLNKESEIEWNCWIDTMDDISVLGDEGEFKAVIRSESLKQIIEQSKQS